MDRIEAMQTFVTVADLQGFAPAARKLRLSPPAVTRLIAALEERLGTRLLQRTTRKVALTDAGAFQIARAGSSPISRRRNWRRRASAPVPRGGW